MTGALATAQKRFLAAILEDDIPFPEFVDARRQAGLDIYRSAYRSRLLEALSETFERTRRLVGVDAFARAAAHHVIVNPPASWSLDHVGSGFAETCADLFLGDPDVAEIAALEWAMAQAFTAADAPPLEAKDFAVTTAGFSEADWSGMRLDFLPGTSLVAATYDLVGLWNDLADPKGIPHPRKLSELKSALVWREGHRPVFILVPRYEAQALRAMLDGADYGSVCDRMLTELGEEAGLAEAGAVLGRWVRHGLVRAVATGLQRECNGSCTGEST